MHRNRAPVTIFMGNRLARSGDCRRYPTEIRCSIHALRWTVNGPPTTIALLAINLSKSLGAACSNLQAMRRLSFSISTLLVLTAVLAGFLRLNLRPTYPNAPPPTNELIPMFLSPSYDTWMAEYGWPFGCVHVNTEFDLEDKYATVYRIRDVLWVQLFANVAVAFIACVVIALSFWWCSKRLYLRFNEANG